MIPQEIEYREVDHGFIIDDYAWGEGIFPQGHVKDEVFHGWESAAAEKAYWKDRRRADEARKALGGFGFCSSRVNG